MVAEYIGMMRLRKLGYVFNTNDLSCFKADAFIMISEELDKLEEQERKKNNGRR